MNLETILADEDLYLAYITETGDPTKEGFEREIRRLFSNWKDHQHSTCTCLLCR